MKREHNVKRDCNHRSHGKRRRIFVWALAACLALMFALPASGWSLSAEASDVSYTYTVRFFAGAQGTIGGQEMMTFPNLRYGERVTFNQSMVSLKNGGKYYIRGLRESGKDNDTANGAASFLVTGDQDYVVAYGVLGNAVAYTIRYQDANGNTLEKDETFYGNVGDKPVVAFKYIEGYQPQAYNLTKTLSENAAENVFIFIYSPAQGGEAAPDIADNDNNPGGTEGTGTDTDTEEGTDEDAGAEGEDAGADADADADANAGENVVQDEDNEVPQEMVDLDNEAPLANIDAGDDDGSVVGKLDFVKRFNRLPLSVKVAIVGCFIVAVTFLGWFFLFRKKKRRNKNG